MRAAVAGPICGGACEAAPVARATGRVERCQWKAGGLQWPGARLRATTGAGAGTAGLRASQKGGALRVQGGPGRELQRRPV